MQRQTYRAFYKIVEPSRSDSNQGHIYATQLREFMRGEEPIEISRQAARDEGGMPFLKLLLNELAAALETFARQHPEQFLSLPAPKPGKADDGWHVFGEPDCLITLEIDLDADYVHASVGKR